MRQNWRPVNWMKSAQKISVSFVKFFLLDWVSSDLLNISSCYWKIDHRATACVRLQVLSKRLWCQSQLPDYFSRWSRFSISCINLILGKSILPHDFSITLKKDEPQSFEVTSCNAELFKSWLATVKSLQYKVDNDEVVQNFIVETRKGKFDVTYLWLHCIDPGTQCSNYWL